MQFVKPIDDATGLGDSNVQRFYHDATIFITGGTGFIGKQLLEKLFRSCDIKKAFVLIRPKKGKPTKERLQNMLSDPVFEPVFKKKPDLVSRIVCVEGDVASIQLGISNGDWSTMVEEVDIIFHVAATIKLDENIHTATLINVQGTKEALTLGRACRKLRSFVYVSIAHSHSTLGHTGNKLREQFYKNLMPAETLLTLVNTIEKKRLDTITLSLTNGWPTYTFTKAVAEKLVESESRNIPVCIVRPLSVMGSSRESMPGWIDMSCVYDHMEEMNDPVDHHRRLATLCRKTSTAARRSSSRSRSHINKSSASQSLRNREREFSYEREQLHHAKFRGRMDEKRHYTFHQMSRDSGEQRGQYVNREQRSQYVDSRRCGQHFNSERRGQRDHHPSIWSQLSKPNTELNKKLDHKNILPEFDLSAKTHHFDVWLRKVNKCASVYGWDNKTTIHSSIQKLQGLSKNCYQCLNTIQFKLLKAFPCEQNNGQSLKDMIRRCKINEPITRASTLALRCSESKQLQQFLLTSKENSDLSRCLIKPSFGTRTSNETSNTYGFEHNRCNVKLNAKPGLFCYNCKEKGHPYLKCTKLLIKCCHC